MDCSWECTDNDSVQYQRKTGSVYEMIQAIWLDTTKKDLENGLNPYIVVTDAVDMDSLSGEDIEIAIASYGYTVTSLINEYGDAAIDIVAECYLEDSSCEDGNIIYEAKNFEDAKNYIEKYIKQR